MEFGSGVMQLHRILRQAGIIPNDRVIHRITELKGFLRTGRLPNDLLQKLNPLHEHQCRQAWALPMMAEALRRHHSGGPRLPEPLASLVHYTLAYLWEEHDDISDEFLADVPVQQFIARESF